MSEPFIDSGDGPPPLKRLSAHRGFVTSLAFANDGQMVLASGSMDSTARLWDVETGRQIMWYEGHAGAVTGVAFSPDGNRLATSSDDGSVRVWEVSSGRLIQSVTDFGSEVIGVGFIDNGNTIVACTGSGLVRLLDTASGEELDRYAESIQPRCFCLDAHPDRPALYTDCGGVDNEILRWVLPKRYGGWSEDDEVVELACEVFGIRYDPRKICPTDELGPRSQDIVIVAAVAVTQDPTCVAVACSSLDDFAPQVESDYGVWIGEVVMTTASSNGRWDRRWTAHQSIIRALRFSPSSPVLATAADDALVKLWDVPTRTLIWTGRGHTSLVRTLAFSPEGSLLASGGDDNAVLLWSVS